MTSAVRKIFDSSIGKDKRLKVETIRSTNRPNALICTAMRQCHSKEQILDIDKDEQTCGRIVVDNLLAGDRGHYGCLEHPAISFSVGGFPHTVISQLRTHRVGVSFDVQSLRHCVMDGDIEDTVYLRQPGQYSSKCGTYYYNVAQRDKDLEMASTMLSHYKQAIDKGMAAEQARSLLPTDIRQNFVLTCNMRSLMHLLDLRAKRDAQEEIQYLMELFMGEFLKWSPEIAEWYITNRHGKARLSP